MVPCLFTFDPSTDTVTLDAEDDSKHFVSCPLAALGPVKYTRGESRLVFTIDGQKYRLVFQSGGNILASTAARRFAGAAVGRKLVANNGYDDWFALLVQRGHIG